MAKDFEDKFYREMQTSVIDENTTHATLASLSSEQKVKVLSELPFSEIKQAVSGMTLEEQKSVYLGCISALESNVIKDPRTLENLRKELSRTQKELDKKRAQKSLEDGDITGKAIEQEDDEQGDDKSEHDKSEIIKVEKKNEQEKDKSNEEVLKQAYYDAIVAYYDARLKSVKHQREKRELIASDLDYKREERLELAMYNARIAYMSTGNEDPYAKFRARHEDIDRRAHEPFERELREKAARYREIESEIEQIDKGISEINEELVNKKLGDRDRAEKNATVEELKEKRKKLDLEKAEYKDIETIKEIQRERTSKSRKLQQLRRDATSKQQLKGYDNQRRQRQVSQHNIDVAQATQYANIEKRIQDSENKINSLEKKLKATPDSDLRERLNILEELNKETNELQFAEDQKDNLDKGYQMTESEMQQETIKAAEIAEETKKEFKQDTREVREALEQKDKVEGEMTVEQPSIVGEQDREIEIKTQAAVVAAVVGSDDTIVEAYGKYKVAECVIKDVEKLVRDPDNIEDAQAIVEHDEQLRQADKELDAVQQSLEQKN